MAQKRKLTRYGTGNPTPKSLIHQQKPVVTRSLSRQRSLISTNKDNNPIEKKSSSPKKISSTPTKNDQLQESTKKFNMSKSTLKIGETSDVDQGIKPD